MKTHYLLLLVPVLLLAACHSSQNLKVGLLTLSTDKPQQGEKINIYYRSDSGSLAHSNDLKGTLYYAVKNKIYAQSLTLADSGKAKQGTFTLPDTAQAFALKFSADDETDNNNDNGYIFSVYDKAGKPLAGALAAEGGFYHGMGSYLLGIKTNQDTLLTLLQKDMTDHPEIKKDWQAQYLNALLMVKKDSAYPEIRKGIKEMLSSDSAKEEDYIVGERLYEAMKEASQADSIKQLAIKKFPQGSLVQSDLAQAFSKQKDADSMVALYNQFIQQFHSDDPKSSTANIASYMLSRIANAYAGQNKYDKMVQYAAQINNKSAVANLYNSVAWDLAGKGNNLAFADSISKLSLDLLQQQIDNPASTKPTYYTTDDWKENLQSDYGNDADTYAMILDKEGKLSQALQVQKKAVEYTKEKTGEINERYVAYLIKSGDYATAQKEMEKYYESGNVTSKMDEYLKTAYVKQHNSDEGYTTYLAGLEAKAEARIKKDLAKKMIDDPAKTFSLPDLNGQDVSLASLKGKVVILDFWATWCGPCKASFPGMQQALTKFKNDSNVVFLFVNTWENTQPAVRQKAVSDFIKQNKYTFHVLMDQHNKSDSTQYQVVKDYGVDGIPTKFIIDPEGHIRFKLVGFGGNTDNEVKEISTMIGMLKG